MEGRQSLLRLKMGVFVHSAVDFYQFDLSILKVDKKDKMLMKYEKYYKYVTKVMICEEHRYRNLKTTVWMLRNWSTM